MDWSELSDKMDLMNKHITATLALSALLLTSCGGKTDIDKIADAQSCLDTAKSYEADACVSKVDGVDTEGAYLIRCIGKFIKEGFNESSKLANAVAQLSSGGNGSNGSTGMMAALAFKGEATTALNSANAQVTFGYCKSAKAKGLILLSGLVQTSTTLTDIAGGNLATLDGTALRTIMASEINNPVAQAAVGSAVVGIYSSNCENGQTTNGNFCAQFETAINSVGGIANTNAIGQKIMFCYTNPSDPSCAGFAN